MCGRYTLAKDPLRLREHFDLRSTPAWSARYNIAPAQPVPVIAATAAGEREWGLAQWGLRPAWAAAAPDAPARPPLINARGETIATKPAFRGAFRQRRCLLPADGFYEWRTEGGQKQPSYFRRRDGGLFAFAAVWEPIAAPGAAGGGNRGCAIVTTQANELVAAYHDRMPVMLHPSQYDVWLRAAPAAAAELLRPYAAEEMAAYPVAPRWVNSARFDGPECVVAMPQAASG